MKYRALLKDSLDQIFEQEYAHMLDSIESKVFGLLMELRHPAYRMALDNTATKETMVRRINDIAGEEICTAIRFAAPGMFAPERKK